MEENKPLSYPECLEPTRVEEYYEEDRKYSPVIERLIARTDLSKARNRYTLTHTQSQTHTHTHTDRNPIPSPDHDKKYSPIIERLISQPCKLCTKHPLMKVTFKFLQVNAAPFSKGS